MPPVKKIKGRYEVKAILGEAGMGVVYRAYDLPMGRDVALKTLLEFPDRTSLQLFYKECEVLKSLSHPNVVEIFDMGEFEDSGQRKPFFVMPLLRGHTLDQLIRDASHRLTVERVVEIMVQTCRGLQAAHEHGLVHRDLKPSNLWVMEDDAVKIIDFGVAHTVNSRTRSSGFQKGTLLYMAPEQIQFKPLSPQSDIFSMAIVCYEALTRRQPFRGNSEEEVVNDILKHIPPPASEINPAVNQSVSRVVHKAMAKQPWNRFDSAREFGETLQKALWNEPIELFDPARIQPRIKRAVTALDSGDYQFAAEIVAGLEAEANLDPQLTLLRTQIDHVVRQKTIAQLLESAQAPYEEDEDPLALQKIQDVLRLDPNNVAALGLKSKIENRRSERQIGKWLRLAKQHIDSHSYSHARAALQNVTQLKPNEPRALRLLSDIEGEEQEYLRLRKRKAQVYQSALNAWKNGEVSQALTEMGIVLELDHQAPDTSSPETSSTYQNFYNQVSSEHDAISTGYAEAKRALSDGDYAKAQKLCQEFLTRYPNQSLFQALKFDVEQQQRQQLSAFIAEINGRLEAERDLDAKLNLLRDALAAYPDEAHFQRSLRLNTDKRDLVNSILARARSHEQQGQINEALSDLETLRTIYGQYPGLQFEVEGLQKRRDQQARDEAKARRLEQIDRQLGTGNYGRSLELLQKAQAEFPNDAELVDLEKLARQSFERATQAEQLLTRGQELCEQGQVEEGVTVLRQARQLDERNPGILAALRYALVEQARTFLEKDWRAAETLDEQRKLLLKRSSGPPPEKLPPAVVIDPQDPSATNIVHATGAADSSAKSPAPRFEMPGRLLIDNVHFTLTGQNVLGPGRAYELLFWVHVEQQKAAVLVGASAALRLPISEISVKSEGPYPLQRGSRLSVRMKIEGVTCLDSHKWITWTGEVGSTTFVVEVPPNASEGTYAGSASIRLNGCEIAKMSFVVRVGPPRLDLCEIPSCTAAHRKAFASYASQDRVEVLNRIQGMEAAYKGLRVFVDVAALRSGQNWEQELSQRVSDADVFYLFWCRHASKSEWVSKEWHWALHAKGENFIDPIPLETPELAPPPRELAAKHFNDPLLAFIAAAGGGHSRDNAP